MGNRIDRDFLWFGIRSHQTIRVTGVLNGTCIGIDHFHGTCFGPSVHELVQLLHTLTLLVDSDLSAKVAPVGLTAVLGVVNGLIFWRGRFSPFLFIVVSSPDRCRKLRHRRSQQMHRVSFSSACPLAHFCEVDLQRPWSPTLVVTGPTDAFGFGRCAATANTDHVHRLGRLCVDHQAMAILSSKMLTRKRKNVFHLHEIKFCTLVSSVRRFSAPSGQLEVITNVLGLE